MPQRIVSSNQKNGGVHNTMSANREDSASSKQSEKKDLSSSTGVDTLLGRVVVEQGLVTPEEMQLCLEQQRQRTESKNSQSLTALLVENEFITNRQLRRARREIEAQKTTQQIPGYIVKRKLGAGAMAKVFLAKQVSLDRYVAIKVLPQKFSSNAQFIERFYKEGQAAAKLNHPNIVQAYDVGQAGEFHYFVMEYVDGKTVHEYIQQRGKYSEREALDIILQIADALQHAHDRGFVHRDVKPKNIMIAKDGTSKLADMGLARALADKDAAEAEAGRAFGTPYYISPEQIRGEVNIGPQADIYSLGATFYHMVTGQVPFDGENPSGVMHKHLKAELIPPDHVNPNLSPGTAEIVEMMMAKSRRHRYQNCKDIISDLRAVRDNQPPPIAHKELDLSGLTGGAPVHNLLSDTAVSPSINTGAATGGRSSIMESPAFLAILIVAAISLMGNIILFILNAT